MRTLMTIVIAATSLPCISAERISPLESIVYVESQRAPYTDHDKVEISRGTGFIISEGHFLTAAHVIFEDLPDYAESYVVSFGSRHNHSYRASLVKIDRDLDLALLSLPENIDVSTRPLTRGDSDAVRSGERLTAYGFPSTLDLTIAEGILSSKRVPPKSYWQTTMGLNRGQSGGPVFNSKGEWVAIAVAGSEDMNSVTFAIPERYADGLVRLAVDQGPSDGGILPIKTIDFQYASAGQVGGSLASATQRACLPVGYKVAAAVVRTGSDQIGATPVSGASNCIDVTPNYHFVNYKIEDLEIIGVKDEIATETIRRAVADDPKRLIDVLEHKILR